MFLTGASSTSNQMGLLPHAKTPITLSQKKAQLCQEKLELENLGAGWAGQQEVCRALPGAQGVEHCVSFPPRGIGPSAHTLGETEAQKGNDPLHVGVLYLLPLHGGTHTMGPSHTDAHLCVLLWAVPSMGRCSLPCTCPLRTALPS